MKIRGQDTPIGLRVALVALALALVTVAGSLVRALRVRELATVSRAEAITIPRVELSRGAPGADLRVALRDDPFSPERTRPARRYRLPGEVIEGQIPESSEPAVPRVLGTVIATDGGSFATCAIRGEPPKNVRVGEYVGPYVVSSIERGRVVFVAESGRRVEVRTTRITD